MMSYPRSWVVTQNSELGSQVVITSNEDDPFFKTNLNMRVDILLSKDSLEKISQQSITMFHSLLDDYKTLSSTWTKLDELKAIEITSQYLLNNDPKILRTIIALDNQYQYVLTIAYREKNAKSVENTIDQVLKKIKIGKRQKN